MRLADRPDTDLFIAELEEREAGLKLRMSAKPVSFTISA